MPTLIFVGKFLGFQIAGELIGMDGLMTGEHALDAIALEDSLVCVIAFRVLETLGHEHLDIQRQLHRLMSREIVRESAHMMLIGTMTAAAHRTTTAPIAAANRSPRRVGTWISVASMVRCSLGPIASAGCRRYPLYNGKLPEI